MDYTVSQQKAFNAAAEGKNIFLTGKAGTGKSFIVKEIMKHLKIAGRKYVAVAPTGIAANNIGGQTIHSLFSITPYGISSFETCNRVKSEKRRLLNAIDTVIIDEISMVRPDILDAMNWTLIKNGCKSLYTKQIIIVGDMAQLPPVIKDNDRAVLYRDYDGDTWQYAKVCAKLNITEISLDEVVRQSDPEFIHNLNIIRDGGRSEYFRRFTQNEVDGIVLAPYTTTVNMYNISGLHQQQGELFTFEATIEGNVKADDFNLETTIEVKNGCKIMYLANSQNNPLVNGTLGIFVSHNDCHYIRVRGVDYALQTMQFTKKEYVYNPDSDSLELKEIGKIVQYPFKLAYALTIHKSQGLTFDNVILDLSRPCFTKGQLYVGLSRVTSPKGLKIII